MHWRVLAFTTLSNEVNDFVFKDTQMEKAPSNKTPVLKNVQIGASGFWVYQFKSL